MNHAIAQVIVDVVCKWLPPAAETISYDKYVSELLLEFFKVLVVGLPLLDSITLLSKSGYTLVELLDVHLTTSRASTTRTSISISGSGIKSVDL